MWEIDNALQIIGLARSALFGLLFALLYDVFRALRKVYDYSAFSVFLQDIAYFAVISPIMFLLTLSLTNGELRLYVFIGVILGFFLTRILVSKIFVFLLVKLFGLIKILIVLIGNGVDAFINKISKIFNRLISKLSKFINLRLKKEKTLEEKFFW